MPGASEEKKKELLDAYLTTDLPKFLTVMQKRLLANTSQRVIVGDAVTMADMENAMVAYAYFFNESNQFYKEQNEVVMKPEFAAIRKYFEGLSQDVFADYFKVRISGKPF